MASKLYQSDPNIRVSQQLAEAAITEGLVEDRGARSVYPLEAMEERARFISALLRIMNQPNTPVARDALESLKELGVMREIGIPASATTGSASRYDSAFDNEYAGVL